MSRFPPKKFYNINNWAFKMYMHWTQEHPIIDLMLESDVDIKSSHQFFSYTPKVMFSKEPKMLPNIWATFQENLSLRLFKNSPIKSQSSPCSSL